MIYTKKITEAPEFLAGDQTLLRELLHPKNDEVDIKYSIAYARLKSGTASIPHRLAGSEVYYILQGNGQLHIGNEKTNVAKGQVIYVPNGALQYIENTGIEELIFLCIVEPAWTAEDEIIE